MKEGYNLAGNVRDYPKLAKDILEAVGGEENIVGATRCATRLRLVLKRSNPKAKEEVSAMPGVVTVVENSGQFQVVIGQHVGEVLRGVFQSHKLRYNKQHRS